LFVQGFIIRKEIYREGSDGIEKQSHSLITILMSYAIEFFDKILKNIALSG